MVPVGMSSTQQCMSISVLNHVWLVSGKDHMLVDNPNSYTGILGKSPCRSGMLDKKASVDAWLFEGRVWRVDQYIYKDCQEILLFFCSYRTVQEVGRFWPLSTVTCLSL